MTPPGDSPATRISEKAPRMGKKIKAAQTANSAYVTACGTPTKAAANGVRRPKGARGKH